MSLLVLRWWPKCVNSKCHGIAAAASQIFHPCALVLHLQQPRLHELDLLRPWDLQCAHAAADHHDGPALSGVPTNVPHTYRGGINGHTTRSQLLFSKRLNQNQWLAIMLIALGCMLKEASKLGSVAAVSANLVAWVLLGAQMLCSVLAGVYNELLLKTETGRVAGVQVQSQLTAHRHDTAVAPTQRLAAGDDQPSKRIHVLQLRALERGLPLRERQFQ